MQSLIAQFRESVQVLKTFTFDNFTLFKIYLKWLLKSICLYRYRLLEIIVINVTSCDLDRRATTCTNWWWWWWWMALAWPQAPMAPRLDRREFSSSSSWSKWTGLRLSTSLSLIIVTTLRKSRKWSQNWDFHLTISSHSFVSNYRSESSFRILNTDKRSLRILNANNYSIFFQAELLFP